MESYKCIGVIQFLCRAEIFKAGFGTSDYLIRYWIHRAHLWEGVEPGGISLGAASHEWQQLRITGWFRLDHPDSCHFSSDLAAQT